VYGTDISVAEGRTGSRLLLHPNPVRPGTKVTLTGTTVDLELDLVDELGRVVQWGLDLGADGSFIVPPNVAEGVYHLRAQQGSGTDRTMRSATLMVVGN
jgi:hypothetical protein